MRIHASFGKNDSNFSRHLHSEFDLYFLRTYLSHYLDDSYRSRFDPFFQKFLKTLFHLLNEFPSTTYSDLTSALGCVYREQVAISRFDNYFHIQILGQYFRDGKQNAGLR